MLKVDIDESIELAVKFKVTTMPTFFYLKNGKIVESVVGAHLPRVEDAIVRFNN